MFKLRHRFLDEAPADGGAAGGADGGAADTGQPAADTGGSALGGAAPEANQVSIPEKYHVKNEAGELDLQASSQKLAEAYGHLEKRVGTGDLPPKAAEEYQVTVPDALKDTWNPAEDALLADFKADALKHGLTQGQFDFVLGKYLDLAPGLVQGGAKLSMDDCVADLKTEWKTDEQYKTEMGKAYQAAVAYGGKDADGLVNDYGNDPRLIRLLNRVGAELGEDKGIANAVTIPGGQSVESLMASEAYNNPKHADHARVSQQVKSYFDSQAAAQQRAGQSYIL